MKRYAQDNSLIVRFFAFMNKWIILEPSIFLFLMSARMVYFTRQNLFIDVVCMGMGDVNKCQNMTEEFKDKVAIEAADMISVILRIENIGPILLCVLSGPVSDKYGRKVPLLLSSLGMLASYAGYLLLSLLDPRHQLSSLHYILPSIGISLGGQFFVFFQMFFAYTSDVSELKGENADYKFRRFIIAEGSVYFGAVTGSYVGGLMYTKVGYTNVFLASIILMIGRVS